MKIERILDRATNACVALNEDDIFLLNAGVASVRRALQNQNKPLCPDHQDKEFRDLVKKYFDTEVNLRLGLMNKDT